MTIREIFISLGFQLDKNSESNVNKTVENLRDTASNMLENLKLGFEGTAISDAVDTFQEIRNGIDESTVGTRALEGAQQELADTLGEVGDSTERTTQSVLALTSSGVEIREVVKEGEKWVDANGDLVDSLEEVQESYEDLGSSVSDELKEIIQQGEQWVDANGLLVDTVDEVKQSYDELIRGIKDEVPIDVPLEAKPEISKTDEGKFVSSLQGLKKIATGIIGIVSVVVSMANANAVIEEFSAINQQIASAVGNTVDLKEAQNTILESANNIRMSYESTATAVSDLVSSSPDIFASVEDAAAYNETCVKLFKSAGKSNEEIEALVESIGTSYKKGAVDSGTISTLLEQSPEAVALLNEKLGTTSEQLETLASEGAISLQDLTDAFMDNADGIDAAFGDVKYNISDALLNIRNQWGFWLSDMDETYGVTEKIGTAMVTAFSKGMDILKQIQTRVEWVVEKFGGLQNVLNLVGIIGAAALGTMLLPKILGVVSGFMQMDKSLLMAKAKMLAMVAVVVLIALLIQDFIAFMKGEDSVIGALFEKAGIDADKAREVIITAWETVKTFLVQTWEFLLDVAQVILTALTSWWEKNGEDVLASLQQIWQSVLTLCTALWEALKAMAIAIFTALKVFWDAWGETIISFFVILFNTIVDMIGPLLDALAALVSFFANLISGDWAGACQAMGDFFTAVCELLVVLGQGILEALFTIFQTLVEVVINLFTSLWDGLKSIVSGIVDTIVDGFTEAITWIKALPSQAVTWGKDIILGIVDGIKGAMSLVTDAVSDVANSIKSVIGFSVPEKGPLSNFDTYMPDMIDLMVEGIEGTKNKVIHSVEDLASDISDEVNQEVATPDISVPEVSLPEVENPSPVVIPVSMGDVDGIETSSSSDISREHEISEGGSTVAAKLQDFADKFRSILDTFLNKLASLVMEQRKNKPLSPEKDNPDDNNPKDPVPQDDNGGDSPVIFPGFTEMGQKFMEFVSENKDQISNLVEKITSITTVVQMDTVATPDTFTRTEGAQGNNTTINQNVEINNEFNGDQAGQQKSSEAMDKASHDTSDALARAIRFAH